FHVTGVQTCALPIFPSSGEIVINGMNWMDDAKQLRAMMGLSLQETKFIDKVTVEETMELFASFYNLSKARAAEVIGIVNLEAKRSEERRVGKERRAG